MKSCTFDIEATNPVVDELGFAEDFSVMSFRIVPSEGGCGAKVHVSPFELATMITRLSELHLFAQSKLLEAQLGAPTTPLKLEYYQVDASLSGRSVSLRVLPKGIGTSYLAYSMPTDMARKMAHELLAAADAADRQKPLVAN